MTSEVKQKLTRADFVHLHNHTNHSMLDGLTKIGALVDRVKEWGMSACAITDHGTLSGWIEYYKTAKEAGVKPILGIETYVAQRKYTDKDAVKDKARYHLILLAMNNTGANNLMRLSTKANLDGYYYKPRVDHDLLEEYNEGIICLSGCASGELAEALNNDDYEKALEIAKWYKKVFGDRYYIELQDHGHPDAPKRWDQQMKVNEGLKKISKELDIPPVVTCDAHYLNEEDTDAHEVLLCVGTGSLLTDEKRMSLKDFHLHVTDPNEIIARWGDEMPEAITNTKKIADRCDVTIELERILIPTFDCPNDMTEKDYLHHLVWTGLVERYSGIPHEEAMKLTNEKAQKHLKKEQIERAKYELKIIDDMGFNGYFLIVWDFINWGKSQGIVFGPGRGSAAGAIIAYALRITDLDPMKYDLLFERFLNPDRISMPDIDIDIQDNRRDEVIQYCSNKYGADRVSNIMTFGTMAAKGSVRDVARVFDIPYSDADRLSKTVPDLIQGRHVPLKDSVVDDHDLHREYVDSSNPWKKEVLDMAMILEGTIRSHGVHACGVVIAPDALVNYLPLEMAQKGVVATQFPAPQVEEIGLLKMDFLGLSNLTVISDCIKIVERNHGVKIDIDQIPLDDKKTFELFQRADTTGVFQLESAGMKRYLKDLKASEFEDIIAMVALYRPGPMGEIPKFINRKHGVEPIEYYEEHMKNALENTYGILVYQEQFMQISKEVCGFTGGEADTLRKAVGKKKIDLMKKMKDKLIEGGVKHSGADRKKMEAFWDHLEEFANYCFNKSHAACYGLVAYWTAYLKAHYPAEFMAALMTSDSGNTDRLSIEISECNKMGISVMNPDINESFIEFSAAPDTGNIRFGLPAIKGVGTAAVEVILSEREKGGPFKSIEDYARRVNSRVSNKKVWESLIKGGAFDKFGDRSDLLFSLEAILEFASKTQKEAASGQVDLFGILGDTNTPDGALATVDIKTAPQKHTDKEKLQWERELLGLYLSGHPLDKYGDYVSSHGEPLAKVKPERDKESVSVCVLVSDIRVINTKKGDKMAFVMVEDKTGESEIIVFPKIYQNIADKLKQDELIKVTGKISGKDASGLSIPEAKIIADTINIISDETINAPENPVDQGKTITEQKNDSNEQKLYIRVAEPENIEQLNKCKNYLMEFPGNTDVILVLGPQKDIMRLPLKAKINNNLTNKLENLYGKEQIVVK